MPSSRSTKASRRATTAARTTTTTCAATAGSTSPEATRRRRADRPTRGGHRDATAPGLDRRELLARVLPRHHRRRDRTADAGGGEVRAAVVLPWPLLDRRPAEQQRRD